MKRRGAVLLCALLLILGGCDGGGGDGDDDDAELLAAPEYNLTGCWEITERPECDGTIIPRADLDVLGIDYVEGVDEALDELETDRLGDMPTRVRQDGNDLELTETSSGIQAFGTIAGDQVRYRVYEEILGIVIEVEARGTALSRDVVALTETYEFASDDFEGAVVCEFRTERIEGAAESCIVE